MRQCVCLMKVMKSSFIYLLTLWIHANVVAMDTRVNNFGDADWRVYYLKMKLA